MDIYRVGSSACLVELVGCFFEFDGVAESGRICDLNLFAKFMSTFIPSSIEALKARSVMGSFFLETA